MDKHELLKRLHQIRYNLWLKDVPSPTTPEYQYILKGGKK